MPSAKLSERTRRLTMLLDSAESFAADGSIVAAKLCLLTAINVYTALVRRDVSLWTSPADRLALVRDLDDTGPVGLEELRHLVRDCYTVTARRLPAFVAELRRLFQCD